MKTLKEYIDLNWESGYLKRGDKIDIDLAMHLTDDRFNEETYETWDGGAIQGRHLADVIAGQGTYTTVYRVSKYEPFTFMGECFSGSLQNRNPALSRKIYVCSRYRANTKEEMDQNIADAKEECGIIAANGDIPIAPHLYFPQFLNDDDPLEREFGIQAGMRALEECDMMIAVIRDEVISQGMDSEMIRAANTFGIPVEIHYYQTEKR